MLFGLNSNADEALKGQIIDGSLLTSDDYASDIKVLQPEDLDVGAIWCLFIEWKI